jgi:hypothetical protein
MRYSQLDNRLFKNFGLCPKRKINCNICISVSIDNILAGGDSREWSDAVDICWSYANLSISGKCK